MTDSFEQHLLALSDASLPVRVAAAEALLQAKAVQSLQAALHHANVETRWRAGILLGWLADVNSVSPLVQALGDEEWAVRHSAVWALGRIPDEQAAEALHNILHAHQSEEQVHYVSAMGLVNHRSTAADRHLHATAHTTADAVRRPLNAALINPQFREG